MQEFIKEFEVYYNKIKSERESEKFYIYVSELVKHYLNLEGKRIVTAFASQIIEEKIKPLDGVLSKILEFDNDVNLNVKETCEFLKVSRFFLYKQKGSLHFPKPKRIGKRVIYSKKELVEYLNKVQSLKRGPPMDP